ncbi:HD domain-containing protein [Mucilaginibacter sp. ZT4R22]|uniref:HD domain-containing protein n=1 Tax=Mucilaginibacter pankratovii TaxID=2772110 RepID=A0ABR7WSX2_9SPHI|nr:Pycsar system effector family protein [Mucilaginibacter pankratovii]MBD1365401.1 HD domain-containing protein [Mucilaginibacter pankratovii]
MNYQRLIKKSEKFVTDYFEDNSPQALLYHNLDRTRYVVKAAIKIAGFSGLNEEDLFALTIAAWFHDIGYLQGERDHELAGAQFASHFLEQHKVAPPIIEHVTAIILSTQRNGMPASLTEQIICDADIYHTGRNSFFKRSEALRKETELLNNKEIDEISWLRDMIDFLEPLQFYTTYCRQSLQERKNDNLRRMKTRFLKLTEKDARNRLDLKPDKGSKKINDNERAIDTMFRIASGNSQRLSSMADNKAHILITVNSIILSAIISLLLRKLSENTYLMIPTFILLAVNLFSMIFSILSTRPALPRRKFNLKTPELEKINLLFFGNFYHMEPDEYSQGMHMMMEDREILHEMLIKDVYAQGQVLGKKYHLLRTAYSVFMFGLVVAVLAFILASIFHRL